MYYCTVATCKKTFQTRYGLERHLYKHNNDKSQFCDHPGCNFKCYFPYELTSHKKSHVEKEVIIYECDYPGCNRKYLKKYDFDNHKLKHEQNIKYICDFEGCGKECKNKTALTLHKYIHLDRTFICNHDGCNKKFHDKWNLDRHELTHSGEKPFICDFSGCDHRSTTMQNLNIHKKFHLHIKHFACEYDNCNMKFVTKDELIRHKRSHTNDDRPYPCTHEGCDKKFKQLGTLKNHMKIHTYTFPYICDHEGCDSKFKQSSELKRHKLIHDEEKPIKCEFDGCDRTFRRTHHYECHILTHTGVKAHKCGFPFCGFSAAMPRTLKNHVNAWHSEDGVRNHKRQEKWIEDVLKKANINFKREHIIDWVCVSDITNIDNTHRACVDFIIILKGGIVFLEVDEHQHRFGQYSVYCDMARMAKIVESLTLEANTLPIMFIRINSDTFRVDKKVKKVIKKERAAKLVDFINNIKFDSESPYLQIQYMYYDCVDNKLKIHDDEDYNDNIKQCCLQPII